VQLLFRCSDGVGSVVVPEGVARRTGDPNGSAAPRTHHTLVDADRFLTLTGRLRELRRRIEESAPEERRRARWQRLLVAATDVAQRDLEAAERRLLRLEAELDRHQG
jgi:hypothetical protein